MQGVLALDADKEQPVLGPVALGGTPAARTGLTGIVRIHFDAETPSQGRLIGEQSLQFGKGPFARVSIGAACLLRHWDEPFAFPAACATPDAFADASQLF
jgi:hypothetical protein